MVPLSMVTRDRMAACVVVGCLQPSESTWISPCGAPPNPPGDNPRPSSMGPQPSTVTQSMSSSMRPDSVGSTSA